MTPEEESQKTIESLKTKEKICDVLMGKKIVINVKYGGFGLSNKAFELYLTKKGITFYKNEKDEYGITSYYKVPPEEYDRLHKECYARDGNFKEINSKGWYLSADDIERDDPELIEVIEELGKEANGRFADLKIVEIPGGIDWEISEYDGMESIEEVHRKWH
jgi:hypothetical protein